MKTTIKLVINHNGQTCGSCKLKKLATCVAFNAVLKRTKNELGFIRLDKCKAFEIKSVK